MRHLLLICLSLSLLGVQPSARAADKEEKARQQAKVLYEVGMTAVEEGRFSDAANTFDQAYRLHPNVILLWNAARAHHRAEQFEKARDRYRTCLAEEDLPPKRRQQAADHMVEVELALRKVKPTPPPEETPPPPPLEPPPSPTPSNDAEPPPPPPAPTEQQPAPPPPAPEAEKSAEEPAAEQETEAAPGEEKPKTEDNASPLERVAKVVGRGVVEAASTVERALSGDFGLWDEGGSSWHQHEKLFLRLGLGLGAGSSSLEGTFQIQPTDSDAAYTVGGDFVSSSPLMDMQLQVGMNLSEGWIVHGDFCIGGYTDEQTLEIEREQVDGDDPAAETVTGRFDFAGVKVRNVHLGVGSTLYLLPMNLYVGGGLGMNISTVTHRDIAHSSSAGFGMYVSTGKDWWIDDELSVGVGLRLHASWTDQRTSTTWSVRDDDVAMRDARLTRASDFSVIYGVLGLTVTYD
ncbi:MAG: hypothetical protein VYE15_03290 [Myxococcota bacterium]|nr:hypothetical protein [Myxococcota bacterium]